jgi:hypothetical protein
MFRIRILASISHHRHVFEVSSHVVHKIQWMLCYTQVHRYVVLYTGMGRQVIITTCINKTTFGFTSTLFDRRFSAQIQLVDHSLVQVRQMDWSLRTMAGFQNLPVQAIRTTVMVSFPILKCENKIYAVCDR